MKYSKIHKLDVSNGEGVGVALFVQGCHFHCKNCFNQETWDFDKGKEFTDNIKQQILKLIDSSHISRFTVLGGEPLSDENVFCVIDLLCSIKEKFNNTKEIWVYTGFEYEYILNHKLYPCDKARNMILEYTDILVDGQYIDELKDISLKFRGSSNQRIIDVKKSLEEKQVVLHIK